MNVVCCSRDWRFKGEVEQGSCEMTLVLVPVPLFTILVWQGVSLVMDRACPLLEPVKI